MNMSKEDSQCHVETTKSLEKMTMLLSSSLCKDKRYKTILSSQPSWQKCYYCWGPGHFITECQFLTTDIAEGKIEAHARIDLEQFLKEPLNLSPRDQVDGQWKNAKAFFIEDLPEDGFVELVPNGLVTLQSNWNQDRTPFFVKDLPMDGFVDLMPVCPDIITLNCNLNIQNKKDNLISDLQKKTRCMTKECDMWKVVATEQMNMSVLIASQVSQNIPQSTIQPAQTTEFMTILANMMNFSSTNSQSIKKGFQGSQWLQSVLRKELTDLHGSEVRHESVEDLGNWIKSISEKTNPRWT